VTELQPQADGHQVTLDDGMQVQSRCVIIATGVSYRRLDIPALDALTGAGVFYGAPVSEAPAMVAPTSTSSAGPIPPARPQSTRPHTPNGSPC
jgi:alkyl hydroperoxide reductase subunit AhpF